MSDELLYRHWNGWREGRYPHVLLVDAATGKVLRDLTPGRWDSPTFALGGGPGYAFSPDSRELCFTSNRDPVPATSTNSDLWVVPVAGGAAREWIFTGSDYSAQRAREIQLLNDVLQDPAALMARARELAATIAANSPLAVQGSKHVLGFASRREVDANLDYVAVWNAAFLHSEDLGEAMQAFMQRRPPVFRGQ
mgnify:CR=1 FL=1